MSESECVICHKRFEEKDVKICMICKSYQINKLFSEIEKTNKLVAKLKIRIADLEIDFMELKSEHKAKYQCPFCKVSYYQKENLDRHLKERGLH